MRSEHTNLCVQVVALHMNCGILIFVSRRPYAAFEIAFSDPPIKVRAWWREIGVVCRGCLYRRTFCTIDSAKLSCRKINHVLHKTRARDRQELFGNRTAGDSQGLFGNRTAGDRQGL